MKGLIDAVKWNDDGLAAAITQESATGEVLMLAWMNRESLALTIERGEAVYWSRSRQQLWHKGESSGHTQRVDEMRLDCDGDAILLRVTQHGGISCHTGRRSCFFRRREGDEWRAVEPVVRDPEEIYGNR